MGPMGPVLPGLPATPCASPCEVKEFKEEKKKENDGRHLQPGRSHLACNGDKSWLETLSKGATAHLLFLLVPWVLAHHEVQEEAAPGSASRALFAIDHIYRTTSGS